MLDRLRPRLDCMRLFIGVPRSFGSVPKKRSAIAFARVPDRGADDADVGAGEQASKAAVNLLCGRGSRIGTGRRSRRGS